MTLLDVVTTALWVMLPAYVPGAVAVAVGGGAPVDGGRTWRGRRVLGDGKTWRGVVGGTLAGVCVGLVANAVARTFGLAVPIFPPAALVSLPVGSVVGDAAGSFLKRRLGRERGTSFPPVDQLGFLLGAFVSTLAVAPDWMSVTVTPPVALVALVLTPVFHLGANAVAYLLGLKDVPW